MELPLPRDNQFLFLDMNAFFASCEQHRRPELRGKPVGVTPTVTASGCIIAASYEAKKLGVTTGWRVGEAKRRIPSIQIVDANHRYYVTIHNRISDFLNQEVSPHVIKLSVDEFAIPLTPNEQWTPHAHALALFIKQRLLEIFSPALRCSIGIGPNIFLAKLGTEIQKPDGLVVLQHHTLEAGYRTLKLRDIPGINWKMSYRLNSLGIRTPVDLFYSPRSLLHDAFGISGDAWWYNLHGYRVTHAQNPTQSISHSHVLAPELRTKDKGRAVLYKLFFKVMQRLREKQLGARKITSIAKSPTYRWEYTLEVQPTSDVFGLFSVMQHAYDHDMPEGAKPFQYYVVAYDLEPYTNASLSLFTDRPPKTGDLLTLVDTINARYGRWTVQPASLLPLKYSAQNRITFRTPDYEMD